GWKATTRCREACLIRGRELAAQPSGISQVLLAQPFGAAEDVVPRHVGGIAAGGWMPAERLSERADVMRTGAAAHTERAHIERMGGLGEIRDLEAVAGERVKRNRKRMIARNAGAARIVERLKGRLARRRAVRHRKRRNMALQGFADALEQRQHRTRS